jgi:hypothetical protein
MALVKRLVKESPLTFAEGDGNLDYLENLSLTISSSYATTGSNVFSGSQTIYGNLTVFGTASISHVTSSELNLSTNLITLNTSTPSIRFGGLAVIDSGSLGTGLTGSLLWDSQENHWIYTNPSGSSYDGGMMISGPRNSSGVGNEQGTTLNALMKGQGGDHITSSALIENGTTFTSNLNTVISGSLSVTGIITGIISGSIQSASFASTASYSVNALIASSSISSSYALNAASAASSVSSSYALIATNASTASLAIFATNALSTGYAIASDTASYALDVDPMYTSSYSIFAITSSTTALFNGTGSTVFATTGSNTFRANQTVSGSLTVLQTTILPQVSSSFNFADDAAASGSGIPLGGLYHTSGTIKIRLV